MGSKARTWATWIAIAAIVAAPMAATAHHEESRPGHHEATEAQAEVATTERPVLVPVIGLPSASPAPSTLILAQTRVNSNQGYNSDYIFGLSKALADSTLIPALKVPFFILTIPLDLVFLPFALIGGFFG